MEWQQGTRGAGGRSDALQRFLASVGADRGAITAPSDAATAEVIGALTRAGVDALLLKGRGLTALLYHADEHRSFADVDLLVAPAVFDAAGAVLARLGYTYAGVNRGIDDVGGVVHARTWLSAPPRSSDRPAIDLHRWLPGARADPAVAWVSLVARRTWIELGGHQVAVLDRTGQAVHLATHAAQHGPAFRKHLDELELALARWPAGVWDSAARLTSEIDATEAFAAGLRLCRAGAAEAARLRLPATDELDWKIEHRAERPRGTFHLQALAEASGLRDRADVVRRSLVPPRAWIIHEHPWAEPGGLRVVAAYGLHLALAPAWAARAWRFRWHAQRAGRAR